MEKEIIINDVRLRAEDYKEELFVNEPTRNELRKISFTTNFIGASKLDQVKKLLEGSSLIVKIPETGLDMKMKKGTTSYSYQGNNLSESTNISYSIELSEIDKDLPEDWNILASVANTALMNWIRTRAISELFIEKGLLTKEEYESKIGAVSDRDFEKLKKFIAYGIREKEE